MVYLLDTVKGPVWVRSKVCFQETDENGNEIIYGISEVQDGPDMASVYQALQYSERLLSTFSSICLLVSNYTIWMGYWWI